MIYTSACLSGLEVLAEIVQSVVFLPPFGLRPLAFYLLSQNKLFRLDDKLAKLFTSLILTCFLAQSCCPFRWQLFLHVCLSLGTIVIVLSHPPALRVAIIRRSLLLDSMLPGYYVFSRAILFSLFRYFIFVQLFIPNVGCCSWAGTYLYFSSAAHTWFHVYCLVPRGDSRCSTYRARYAYIHYFLVVVVGFGIYCLDMVPNFEHACSLVERNTGCILLLLCTLPCLIFEVTRSALI